MTGVPLSSSPIPRRSILIGTVGMAAAALASCDKASSSTSSTSANATSRTVTLSIAANAISGGKSSKEADWFAKYVIPEFIKAQQAKGVTATVSFQPSGVDDEQYKSKLALDLKSKSGADIVSLDGIWVGEFAQAGYIKPLKDVVGSSVTSWEGWSQIPEAVQANAAFDGNTFGIPAGTEGRVLYFNKKLFAQAGLPANWQPTSWTDLISAGEKLATLSGVTPLQIDAGTAMGEATTMQGFLPLLVGAGQQIYANGKWQGNTQAVRDVLTFYQAILAKKLEDSTLQLAAKGRDESFGAFAQGKIGVLAEGDYFWRSVINPNGGDAPMATRDSDVGWAFIPAMAPGKGVGGADYASMSGGGGYFLNPSTPYPQQAWELLTFMSSKAAILARLDGAAQVTARKDVNSEVLSKDPLLSFVSQKVLPLTHYRPGLAVYPQVSLALQQATADVVSGKSPADAATAYQAALVKALGGADQVTTS